MAGKRSSQKLPPVPDNINDYLNAAQNKTLKQLMFFGWTIAFVRRPKFLPATVVVIDRDKSRYGVLLENGSVDYSHGFDIREDASNIDFDFRKGAKTKEFADEAPCIWQDAYRAAQRAKQPKGRGQWIRSPSAGKVPPKYPKE